MTREKLIAALEAATGPSRELDFQIWKLLKPEYPPTRGWSGADRYTSSIDAALSLLNEGQFLWLNAVRHEAVIKGWSVLARKGDWEFFEARHVVRAIAICIAALKVRS